MFEVTLVGQFHAEHQLRLLDGSLEHLHAHEWHVRVTCAGPELDAMDVLVDFVPLREHLQRVLGALDGKNLNIVPGLGDGNPSAERVAMYIARRLMPVIGPGARLTRVEVEEEAGCWAAYCPDSE